MLASADFHIREALGLQRCDGCDARRNEADKRRIVDLALVELQPLKRDFTQMDLEAILGEIRDALKGLGVDRLVLPRRSFEGAHEKLHRDAVCDDHQLQPERVSAVD